MCFVGYATVHAFYTGSIPLRASPAEQVSHFGLFLLSFAMFLTGFGGSGGLCASINAVAKSFSDATRATMTGAVLAGFGLSAFTFSTAGHLLYGGDAGGLLLLLACGTGLPMVIGSFLIRPILPASLEQGYERIGEEEAMLVDETQPHRGIPGADLERVRSSSVELSRSMSPQQRGRHHVHFAGADPSSDVRSAKKHVRSSSQGSVSPLHLSCSPRDLLVSTDFWLIFAVLALLCGTGLMYINNAGTVALALARNGKLVYDKKMVSGWQAKQVGTVSIWNCAGRIIGGESSSVRYQILTSGLISDFVKTRFKIQRV